jgi:hypothetical protein
MRFTRLKSKIENGTLTGTNGAPFIGGTKEKAPRASKKRKSTAGEGPSPGKGTGNMAVEEDKLEELGPVVKMRTRGKKVRVKLEDDEGEPGYLSSGGSSEYGDRDGDGDVDTEDDLEDDVPVSKKRSTGLKKRGVETSSAVKNEQILSPASPTVQQQILPARDSPSDGLSGSIPGGSHAQPRTYAQGNGGTDDPYYGYGVQGTTTMQPGEDYSQPPVASLANCSITPQDSSEVLERQRVLKAEPAFESY